MLGKVAVVGAGMTRFHHSLHKNKNGRELFVEAVLEAYSSVDKGIDPSEIGAVFTGYFAPTFFEHQAHVGPLAADWVNLTPKMGWRTESACASASAAFITGYMAVASGLRDVVIVGGIEKMSNLTTEEVTDALSVAADNEYELPAGVTFPGQFATMANAYFKRYNVTWEQLQAIPIKNHRNGALNPKAQFQETIMDRAVKVGKKLGVKFKDELDFLKSEYNRVIAWPLRLFDCSPISDGASAAILVRGELAKKYTDTPVYVSGVGFATDSLSLHDRQTYTSFKSTMEASKQAYRQANVKPKDVDVAEVHDCFSIAEAIATEDLGFFKKGEGVKAAQKGITSIKGDKPINPSGGLKCKGHPVGATGIAMVYEIWKQLRGESGKRQVENAETGLIQNLGGSGASCGVIILRR